uniref:Uncharacterized protein n=1 Tax=Gopherus agassizii TaxID=38772 RepID=A0A452HZL8_9SAUR
LSLLGLSALLQSELVNLSFPQGTYMLQDNQFLLLSQLSNGKQYLEEAPKFLAFTCGLVKGTLSNLGFDSTVTAEVTVMPSSKFQVVIQKS